MNPTWGQAIRGDEHEVIDRDKTIGTLPPATAMPKESTQPTRRSSRLRKSPQNTSTAVEGTRKRATPKLESDGDNLGPATLTSEVGERGDAPPRDAGQGELKDPSPGEVDPTNVDGPIRTIVHRNMGSAWSINKELPMCFIFDSVSPARWFKCGMPYSDSEKIALPVLNDKELKSGNVTETDGPEPGLMPYAHDPYQ